MNDTATDVPSERTYEFAHKLMQLSPDAFRRISMFVELIANGDMEAQELLARINRENLGAEEGATLMDDYLAAKH